MKHLILGGAGFLGLHLTSALLAEGAEVKVFDKTFPQYSRPLSANENIEYIEGDFLNGEDVGHALVGSEIVYHLISTTLPSSSNENPVYDVETNLIATLQMLNLARHNKVKKIIFVSSGGTVYGEAKTIPIRESDETNPACSYGIIKLAIEKYLYLYNVLYGIDYCVLRISNLYGEEQRFDRGQGVVAVFLSKAIKDEVIEIWGDGSIIRDYLYVGDAVEALLNARHYTNKYKVFNIGFGKGHSLNELLDTIEDLLGKPIKRNYNLERKFDVHQNVLDISRAKQSLHWIPRVSFPEGLRRTYFWMLENKG